jgi:hypothetical protein
LSRNDVTILCTFSKLVRKLSFNKIPHPSH